MIRFLVPDMTCSGCVTSVTNAIKNIDTSAEVHIDLKTKQVEITSTASSTSLVKAIEEAGYNVNLLD